MKYLEVKKNMVAETKNCKNEINSSPDTPGESASVKKQKLKKNPNGSKE